MTVKIYSTPSCGYCNKAKAYFREKSIGFTEYNVASDQRKAEETWARDPGHGLPPWRWRLR
ncbi:MAG: NrdH-redoxin [Spirochaeta sp.]|nr:NrdH-redoxin [Spirochaeta sp.]